MPALLGAGVGSRGEEGDQGIQQQEQLCVCLLHLLGALRAGKGAARLSVSHPLSSPNPAWAQAGGRKGRWGRGRTIS